MTAFSIEGHLSDCGCGACHQHRLNGPLVQAVCHNCGVQSNACLEAPAEYLGGASAFYCADYDACSAAQSLPFNTLS